MATSRRLGRSFLDAVKVCWLLHEMGSRVRISLLDLQYANLSS